MGRLLSLALLVLSGVRVLSAQSALHLFPVVVDGRAADGTQYKSTLLITPLSDADIPTCSFGLYGMAATFPGTIRSSTFDLTLMPGTALSEQSSGAQALAIGYGILTCNQPVFANILYSYYAPGGAKLGETTAFPTSFELNRWRLIADEREGARFGIGVANNTDRTQIYDFTLVSNGVARVGSLVVPARQSGTKFLSEIMNVPAGTAGLLTIRSRDLSAFSAMGLRFTGNILTTIPAN